MSCNPHASILPHFYWRSSRRPFCGSISPGWRQTPYLKCHPATGTQTVVSGEGAISAAVIPLIISMLCQNREWRHFCRFSFQLQSSGRQNHKGCPKSRSTAFSSSAASLRGRWGQHTWRCSVRGASGCTMREMVRIGCTAQGRGWGQTWMSHGGEGRGHRERKSGGK